MGSEDGGCIFISEISCSTAHVEHDKLLVDSSLPGVDGSCDAAWMAIRDTQDNFALAQFDVDGDESSAIASWFYDLKSSLTADGRRSMCKLLANLASHVRARFPRTATPNLAVTLPFVFGPSFVSVLEHIVRDAKIPSKFARVAYVPAQVGVAQLMGVHLVKTQQLYKSRDLVIVNLTEYGLDMAAIHLSPIRSSVPGADLNSLFPMYPLLPAVTLRFRPALLGRFEDFLSEFANHSYTQLKQSAEYYHVLHEMWSTMIAGAGNSTAVMVRMDALLNYTQEHVTLQSLVDKWNRVPRPRLEGVRGTSVMFSQTLIATFLADAAKNALAHVESYVKALKSAGFADLSCVMVGSLADCPAVGGRLIQQCVRRDVTMLTVPGRATVAASCGCALVAQSLGRTTFDYKPFISAAGLVDSLISDTEHMAVVINPAVKELQDLVRDLILTPRLVQFDIAPETHQFYEYETEDEYPY